MRIKKVINNNILCVIDEKGSEMIVTGRGIGFGRKVGQFVDPGQVEKTYRMEDQKEQRRLRELVEQIPLEHLRLTEEMPVSYTHLDVYKRQEQGRSFHEAPQRPEKSATAGRIASELAKMQNAGIMHPIQARINPTQESSFAAG